MRTIIKANWLRRVGPVGLAGLLTLPVGIAGAAETSGRSGDEVYRIAHEGFQQELNALEKELQEAAALAEKSDYNGADAIYRKVIARMEQFNGDYVKRRLEAVREEYRRFQVSWANYLMMRARDLAQDGKYREAIPVAQEAQSKDMGRKSIASFIEECQNRALAGDFRKAVSLETVDSEYQNRQKEIDLNLREAKLFIRNNQIESACTRLERVLLVDPFNLDAIEMLNMCYNRLYRAGRARTETDVIGLYARNTWEWMEPLEQIQVDRTTDRSAAVHKRSNTDLYNRLERIVFPTVPLNDSSISQIIRYLNEKSRIYDPQRQGVSIIDNLSAADKQRKVSFELGKTPLLDIIRYLSLKTGLSYTLRGDTVVFGNVDNMSTEFFPVRGDIIAQIIDSQKDKVDASASTGGESGGAASSGAGGGGDLGKAEVTGGGTSSAAAAQSKAENSRNSLALKSYFSERWINFDNGASIFYSPLGQRLVVKNTTENLQRLNALLRQLDALEQPMVLVEAKMIELTDTNLDELGFSWSFHASKKDGSWEFGVTDPTRHGDGGNLFRVLNELKILPNFGEKIFGSDVNVDMSLSINAVAQNRRAEVLSSPRVISDSGKRAEIKMVENTYFITDWDTPDIEVLGLDTVVMTQSEPDWDEEVPLGITLSVTPVVGQDNTIRLEKLNPVFYTHTGDEDNNMTFTVTRFPSSSGGTSKTSTMNYNLRMPILAKRELLATMTVSDGETILIGGMADNENSSRDDRWPILGDIPLLGNLFRDQQTKVINRSMLIFVTARLVDSRGTPLRSLRDRGILDFNR